MLLLFKNNRANRIKLEHSLRFFTWIPLKLWWGNTTCLIETGASVAISNGIVVVVRNYLIDFVSISMSSMSTSVTSMPKAMTSMTSMANRSNTRAYTMSSTEATKLGRGGGQEGRDANEDLEVICIRKAPLLVEAKLILKHWQCLGE